MNYLLAILFLCAGCAGVQTPVLPPAPPMATNGVNTLDMVRGEVAAPNPPYNVLFISWMTPTNAPTNTFGFIYSSPDLHQWQFAGMYPEGSNNQVLVNPTNRQQYFRLARYQITWSTN